MTTGELIILFYLAPILFYRLILAIWYYDLLPNSYASGIMREKVFSEKKSYPIKQFIPGMGIFLCLLAMIMIALDILLIIGNRFISK
ncbi:hypothetical protein GGR92_005267 [Spirosoma lacussanchae]|uniref:hypothetical protein n=1 Tax=Spirosoma lacussanchae TaxID=1884249 RepID=UPI001109A0E5|nr:hypothetical protein [Spirosoma lacussanchae]